MVEVVVQPLLRSRQTRLSPLQAMADLSNMSIVYVNLTSWVLQLGDLKPLRLATTCGS